MRVSGTARQLPQAIGPKASRVATAVSRSRRRRAGGLPADGAAATGGRPAGTRLDTASMGSPSELPDGLRHQRLRGHRGPLGPALPATSQWRPPRTIGPGPTRVDPVRVVQARPQRAGSTRTAPAAPAENTRGDDSLAPH